MLQIRVQIPVRSPLSSSSSFFTPPFFSLFIYLFAGEKLSKQAGCLMLIAQQIDSIAQNIQKTSSSRSQPVSALISSKRGILSCLPHLSPLPFLSSFFPSPSPPYILNIYDEVNRYGKCFEMFRHKATMPLPMCCSARLLQIESEAYFGRDSQV